MGLLAQILPIINLFIIGGGGLWAVYVYRQQQQFRRLQNLSSIWQKFIDNKELLSLFVLCDNGNVNEIKIFSGNEKLRFLGLLEEVALYAEKFEVDKNYAVYLFQWHFYFVFEDAMISSAFWNNLGGEIEIEKSYWAKSRNFAKNCHPNK